MEHREAPGTASDATRRFGRFVAAPRVRRLAPTRIVLAGLAVVLTVAAVVALAELATGWLKEQEPYQLPFHDIVLDPPPPAWYRGGARSFLDRVRKDDPSRETISVLGVDLEAIARDFRLSCWVEKVVRVERSYPNRLVVHLQYRVPVARAEFKVVIGRETVASSWIIDKDGVILPDEEIDGELAGPLIRIVNLDPPFDPRPGRVWKSEKGASLQAQGDERVLAAARLAEFLKAARGREKPGARVRQPESIHILDHTLFIQYGPSTMFTWGEVPGTEAPGQLSAREKWAMFREWVEEHPEPPVESPYYLELQFTRNGFLRRVLDRRRAPEPRQVP